VWVEILENVKADTKAEFLNCLAPQGAHLSLTIHLVSWSQSVLASSALPFPAKLDLFSAVTNFFLVSLASPSSNLCRELFNGLKTGY
jgi:hypothetical protein